MKLFIKNTNKDGAPIFLSFSDNRKVISLGDDEERSLDLDGVSVTISDKRPKKEKPAKA